MSMTIAIIGGGAAGFFAAITCAENNPKAKIIILERGKNVLEKVKISGGGRCNVTHACFEPKELIKFYPRGSKELLSPFSRFCAGDTIDWFEKRGVSLKIEDDGRMFPTTDSSETIVDCLWFAAKKAGVEVRTSSRVENIFPPNENNPLWTIEVNGNTSLSAQKVLIASGSTPSTWKLIEKLGHSIVPPVPSLFTFNIKDKRIQELLGIAVPNATVEIVGTKLMTQGALLITHWGMSGPAILRLSAWGALHLHQVNYNFKIKVNWLYPKDKKFIINQLQTFRQQWAKKIIVANTLFDLPNRLWKKLVEAAQINEQLRWADLNNKLLENLVHQLCEAEFQVNGKSTFKEEFVTAGGVDLKEIDFKTFESKLHKNLFFAGEVLNIDAITGGFNFQAAWTGGWHAGKAMRE